MKDRTDPQLLRAYAEWRSEAAFAELVRRQVDFVYSAALRMVCDSHLAEDVTQGVFVALAKNAGQLADRPVLSGWLHRTAQNIAAQTVRTIERRRAREQEAAAMNGLFSAEPDASWEQIAPHLDAALEELADADRDAVLLRYFEKKSAREMGERLGISDEAAQKRVSRAVDRLREFFAQRGITIGASGLVVVISANAVQAAPAGLSLSIPITALLTGTALTAATKAIAMTALQKTMITATLAAVVGGGIYEYRQANRFEKQSIAFQRQQAVLLDQVQRLEQERDEVRQQLAALSEDVEKTSGNSSQLRKLRNKIALLQNAVSVPGDQAAKDLVARVARLKQQLEATPEANIPELQLLSDQDWLVISRDFDLESAGGVRKALSGLRGLGEQKFADVVRDALNQFTQVNQGAFPTDVADLQPYFNRAIDAAILERWEVLPTGARLPGIGNSGPFVTQKAAVDELLDRRWAVGTFGYSCTDFLSSQIDDTLRPVYQAYSAANNGTFSHDNPSGYLP